MGTAIEFRVAGQGDLDAMVETLAGAFREDPLWGWAFPNGEGVEEWWSFLVSSALRYPCCWVTEGCEAVSIWIPPGGTELTPDEESQVEGLMDRLLGPRASEAMELLDRFEQNHPQGRPHYYLSLLGTHPDHRGKGLGMGLLEAVLRQTDGEGMSCYLESSNPANVPRYEERGFRVVGGFERPDGQVRVAGMWRDPA